MTSLRFPHLLVMALGISGLLILGGCPPSSKPTDRKPPPRRVQKPVTKTLAFSAKEKRVLFSMSPLPAPKLNPSNRMAGNKAAIRMGQFLFFDKRMSPSGKISCATCHDPNKGWSDGRALSKGMEVLPRNSPTLWNVVYNRWQFWDGRADSLWSQARGPIEAGQEMGSSRLFVIHYVSNTPEVKKAYQALFGKLPDFSDTKRFPKHGKPVDDDPDDPLHKAWSGMKKKDQTLVNRVFSNILKVIAAYEGTIVSKDAPFDTFVAGLKENNASKLKALSLSAQRGMKLFVGKGQCTLCHTGPNFTDKEFHNIGLSTPKGKPPDVGRFAGIEVVLKDIFNGLGPFSDNKTDPIHKRLRYLRPTPSKNENKGKYAYTSSEFRR